LLLSSQALPTYEPPNWPTAGAQVHFEWAVEDLDAALDWLQELVGSLAEHRDPDDLGMRVMLDPAGHAFCVMTTASVRSAFRSEAQYQQR